MGSRSQSWNNTRELENFLGLVALIEDRLLTIKKQSWNEGSWDRVFFDSVKALKELEMLKAGLSQRWEESIERATNKKGE